jgi:DNA-binding CsgD family transcriptional regulator
MLADTARDCGELDEAVTLAQEALALCREIDERGAIMADALNVIAHALAEIPRQARLAARLWSATRKLGLALGHPPETWQPLPDLAARVRISLGERAWEACTARGWSLPLETIIDAALALDPVRATTPDRPGVPPTPFNLTRREWDVLRLIGQGHTDREIAGRLSISHRTVNAHVAHILDKLDASTRRQAVTTARDAGLLPGRATQEHVARN